MTAVGLQETRDCEWSNGGSGAGGIGAAGVRHHRMGVAEFLMLDAMAPLATGSARMWSPLATALAACRFTGRAATQALAERWVCPPAELDGVRLHLHASGLHSSADSLSRYRPAPACEQAHALRALSVPRIFMFTLLIRLAISCALTACRSRPLHSLRGPTQLYCADLAHRLIHQELRVGAAVGFVLVPQSCFAQCRRVAMDALHSGCLGKAFELAPPADPWMRDALAPYAHAAVLRHAASPADLGAATPELTLLGGLLEAMVPQTDSTVGAASGVAPAGPESSQLWEGTSAYVRLCRACSRLQDFSRSRRGVSKFDALGVGGLRPLQGAQGRLALVACPVHQRSPHRSVVSPVRLHSPQGFMTPLA